MSFNDDIVRSAQAGMEPYVRRRIAEAVEQERETWEKLIIQALDPEGCGCINDLPGDNYTCTAHQELWKRRIAAIRVKITK